MTQHTPRTFEVPAALVAAGYGPAVGLDELDREVEFSGEYGEWAEKVLFRENAKVLNDVCGDMRLLPRGILSSIQLDDGSVLVAGLVSSEGSVWDAQFNAWGTPSEDVNVVDNTIILTDDEVAFVARALREGADEVWFRPFIPKAFVAAPAPPQDRLGKKSKIPEEDPTAEEIPPGSAIIAVVDPIDEDAVLEMLAITPGPRVLRRHDGQWFEDPEWVPVLKSVRPPKIVKLNEAQVASVSNQVDRSTNDQDWEPFDADTREQYQIFTASSYIQELQRESDERALFALVAVAGKKLSPQDVKNTERLKRYWTVGEGAAKIRWGTPGSWRRCYKHLVKYVGPQIAPGLCTNLGQRLGGPGIATHVTSSAEPVTAANPSGKNGYDSGLSFEESTGGVERDHSGRFAPESGASRSARRKRSMDRSRKVWDESPDTIEMSDKESDTKKKRQLNERQREELAQISLEIAQAVASGDRVKAAQLRVKRAEKRLQFADTDLERINAQTALTNARASLARAQAAKARKRRSTIRQGTRSSTNTSMSDNSGSDKLTADDIDNVLDEEVRRT